MADPWSIDTMQMAFERLKELIVKYPVPGLQAAGIRAMFEGIQDLDQFLHLFYTMVVRRPEGMHVCEIKERYTQEIARYKNQLAITDEDLEEMETLYGLFYTIAQCLYEPLRNQPSPGAQHPPSPH